MTRFVHPRAHTALQYSFRALWVALGREAPGFCKRKLLVGSRTAGGIALNKVLSNIALASFIPGNLRGKEMLTSFVEGEPSFHGRRSVEKALAKGKAK